MNANMKKSLVQLLIGMILLALQGFIMLSQNNTAPIVTITTPAAKDGFHWSTAILYKINVEDKEDGLSKFGEIEEHEVFLQSKFFWNSDSSALLAYEKKIKAEESVLASIKGNACFNCHGVRKKIAAPSFESIALKYEKTPSALSYLASKIMQGGKGVWGDTQIMPSHPQFTKEEAASIAKWILENGTDKNMDIQRGLQGTITPPKTADLNTKGTCILIATYLDHGIDGKEAKEGKYRVLLTKK